MSPAPVRQRASVDRFPHSWGYGLGAILVIAGIAVAVWGVVSGVNGFRNDVNDLRRIFDTDTIEESLERGEEIVIYDEADVRAGPLDVTVIRNSDGAEVATTSIIDGTTYDVDGNSGEASVGFRVPSSDIYRIEVDTSVGQIARFAIGGDITSQSSRITQGLAIGALLALVGLVAIVWTLILHARWRVRHAVLDRVQQARTVVADSSDAVSAEAQQTRVAEATEQASGWARERLDQARARLEAEGDHGQRPEWQQRMADEARRRLDQADAALTSAEPAVGEALAGSDGPDELAGRVGEALERIEERIAAGESLRDIARDERVVAEQAARDLAERADAARAEVERDVDEARSSSQASIRDQVAGLTTDLSDIANSAFEDALGQAGSAGAALSDIANATIEGAVGQASDAGDDLTVGLAATGTAAAAAAGAAITGRGRDALGLEVEPDERDLASTLPAPPGPPPSALPAPPPAPADVVPPPMPPPAVTEEPSVAADEPREAPQVPEPAVAERLATEPRVGVPHQDPLTAAPSVLAPPPVVRPLAPPRAARRSPVGAQPEAAAESGDQRPATRLDSFSALRPAPSAASRLERAPTPAAPVEPAVSPAEPTADEAAEDGLGEGGTELRPFSLAPPPDYSSLGASAPPD